MRPIPRALALSAVALAALFGLASCSGGGAAADALSATVSDTVSSSLDLSVLSSAESAATAVPFSNFGPSAINAPGNTDANSPSASALLAPIQQTVTSSGGSTSSVTTYTPAQIRVAYKLPSLPSSWTGLSASQAAQMGAGQTIYIVDAKHDPNAAAELAAFSQTFGLPTCTTTAIATSATLPLASASTSGCQFAQVYSSGSAMTATAPTYDASWASEIALDVQWAHATAPLARIVLIEAPDASTNSLLGAVNLANAMGAGTVSMSFGTTEGSWTSSVDSAFASANMTYLAATGDSGASVEWPSVSSKVLAVGGTTLNSYTSSARSEVAWSSTGGGISQYTAVPSYQTSSVPGLGSQTYRNVADVAFNANPYTGQYVAIIPANSSTVTWYSVGGTSLATPQWAGIVAVTNAVRAQSSLGPIGLVQNLLYPAASASNFFTTIFNDITSGSNGSYSAHAYYDQPTGLGTPNVSSFLQLASGSNSATQAPVVTPITVNGVVGSALSFSMAVTASNSVSWALANQPSGMTIGSAGLISWPSPSAGTYSVAVTATDSVTHQSGSAVATVVVTRPSAPVITSTSVTGQSGRALSYQLSAQSTNAVTFATSGAVPSGLSVSSSGLLSWASPVTGSYSIAVVATDSVTHASSSALITVTIAASQSGPVITASPIQGSAGHPLSGSVGITDTSARSVTVSIKGAPAGMAFSASGTAILLRWNTPVAGTYTLVFTATDSNGLSAQANLVVTIN